MMSAFGVIGSRSDVLFPKAGAQHFQHLLKKLEVHWVQPEEVVPFPKTASLSFCHYDGYWIDCLLIVVAQG